MRGFALGLVLLLTLSVSVLSLRPGGLRNQLRNIVRRLKLALTLGGIYLVASAALRFAFPEGNTAEFGTAVIAVVLALVLVFLGQDRPPP